MNDSKRSTFLFFGFLMGFVASILESEFHIHARILFPVALIGILVEGYHMVQAYQDAKRIKRQYSLGVRF